MLREELNEKDTWDLTTIFANNEEFEKAFNNANIEIENIKKYENTMINSSDELYQTTKTIYETGEKIDRIYTYANLKYSEDTSNNDSQTLMGRAQELYKKFSEATVFYDTKLISLDEETFEKYISENKNLKEYEIVLRNAYKYKSDTAKYGTTKTYASKTQYPSLYVGQKGAGVNVAEANASVSNTQNETRNTTTDSNSQNTSNSNSDAAVTSKGYKIEVIDGATYIEGVLIANKSYPLPSTYNPGDLTSEVKEAFSKMQKAAASEGLNIYISSGFRSYERQVTVYNSYVQKDGKELADTYSSRPGYSEHQTGLCFDLNSIDDSFGNTAESAWVDKHAHEYGFIVRFPKGKDSATGYQYEPWHLRYVGLDMATKIYNSGLSLEEYFGITSQYAD